MYSKFDDKTFKMAQEKKKSLRRRILGEIVAELQSENCRTIDLENQNFERKESGSGSGSGSSSSTHDKSRSEIDYLVGW